MSYKTLSPSRPAANNNKPPRPRPAPGGPDSRPPESSPDAEAAALGCVLLAGGIGSQPEVDELLSRLRPAMFTDFRHLAIHAEMTKLRFDGHALDAVMLHNWLTDRKLVDAVGGHEYLAELPDKPASLANFPAYLEELKRKALLRWTAGKAARLAELAHSPELSPEQLRDEFAELTERAGQIGAVAPYLDICSPKECRAFIPDPTDALIGEGIISRGQVVTIVGDPGCGKSRLATTLAAAGARGNATWQNFPVMCKWRTLILQSENHGARLKEEFEAIPSKLDDGIRVSRNLPRGLAFLDPLFRRELRRFYDAWPFAMLVIDPWNDVAFDQSQKDYKEALLSIRQTFLGLPKCPAMVVIAHLRKQGRDERGHASGRQLLHWISGSLALGSTSRTVFAVQPVTHDLEDDRIIFEVAKCNDAAPEYLARFGARSAWHRANGAFEHIPGFDWAADWDCADTGTRAVSEDMILAAFNGREVMTKTDLAKAVQESHGVGYSTVMRAVGTYLSEMFQTTPQGWLELVKD